MPPHFKTVADLGSVTQNPARPLLWKARVRLNQREICGPTRATSAEAQSDLDRARQCTSREEMQEMLQLLAGKTKKEAMDKAGQSSGVTQPVAAQDKRNSDDAWPRSGVPQRATSKRRRDSGDPQPAAERLAKEAKSNTDASDPISELAAKWRAQDTGASQSSSFVVGVAMVQPWLQNLTKVAQAKFEYVEDLFQILMVLLPIQIYLSLTGKTGATNLPQDLLEKLVEAQILTDMPDGGMTATELLKSQLSEAAYARLLGGIDDFLDAAKLNRTPMTLNQTDAFLHVAVFDEPNQNFKVALLASIMARKFLNEAAHLLLALEGYQFYTNNHNADISGFVKYLSANEFAPSYAHVIESMLSNFQATALHKAVSTACEIMGVQPRTGYDCGPIKNNKSRIEGFVELISDVVPWINARRSPEEAMAILPDKTSKSDGFHLYQIEQTLSSWRGLPNRCFGLRNVAGPGMLPITLEMIGINDVDGKKFEVATAEPQPCKKHKTCKKGTWKEYRLAVCVCVHLVQILQANVLLKTICEYLQFEINNIDYDLVEYMLCELRRWLERRKRRVTKTGLVETHRPLYTKMRAYLEALRQIQRENLLGISSKERMAVRLQHLLDNENC